MTAVTAQDDCPLSKLNSTLKPPWNEDMCLFSSPELRSFWLAQWIESSGRVQNRKSANHRLLAVCVASEIWNNNGYHWLQKWTAIVLGCHSGPCQSSRSMALAKRIAALGTRMMCSVLLEITLYWFMSTRWNLICHHFVFLEFAIVGWKRPNTITDMMWHCLGNQTILADFYCFGIVYT